MNGARYSQRRVAADFVAAFVDARRQSRSVEGALARAARTVMGPGAEELRRAVGVGSMGSLVPLDHASLLLHDLANKWGTPVLATVGLAIREGNQPSGAMSEYLLACAQAEAIAALTMTHDP